jgi:hypothetical protein
MKQKEEYETKLKRTNDVCELRVKIYEKSYKAEQESCLNIENKAFDILDKKDSVK